MAKNRRAANGRYVKLDVSAQNGSGAGDLIVSGDPIAVGSISGVCQTDEDANGFSVIDRAGVYALSVTGKDAADANVAVAVGDKLYWDNTPGQVNKDGTNGIFLGWALAAVTSGSTATINVLLSGGDEA